MTIADMTPTVTFRCPLGHTKRVALRDSDGEHICRDCHLRMKPWTYRGAMQQTSNHRAVPTPPRPEPCLTVDSRPQCDPCAVGDHGRCTAVGCFCGTSPATRDIHHATNHRRVHWT